MWAENRNDHSEPGERNQLSAAALLAQCIHPKPRHALLQGLYSVLLIFQDLCAEAVTVLGSFYCLLLRSIAKMALTIWARSSA